MSLDPHLHLRRRKDDVEVITLLTEKHRYGSHKDFTAVRYVKSGRKGYIKDNDLECDFVVIGVVDPNARWTMNPRKMFPNGTVNVESASALEELRDRDIAKKRKEVLTKVFYAQQGSISQNALARLDEAIHMILAGV